MMSARVLARGVLQWAVVLCGCATQRAPHGSHAAPAARATVLLSLDGFRADYLARPGAVRLRALAARGVRAERLVPAFPS